MEVRRGMPDANVAAVEYMDDETGDTIREYTAQDNDDCGVILIPTNVEVENYTIFYKEHTDKFLEDVLGVRLNIWQKLFLKIQEGIHGRMPVRYLQR